VEHEFAATGTTWWLHSETASRSLLVTTEALVRGYEARLSRFVETSALSRLNRERYVTDDALAEVLRLAERVQAMTGGAFDARAGGAVIAAGYDRTFEAMRPVGQIAPYSCRPSVEIEGSCVRLHGQGSVDLGGIAKGWIVDRAADLLGAAGPCVVDGGGDIGTRGCAGDGEWRVGVGEGLAVGLTGGAVATSSKRGRRWRAGDGEAHHIVDPGAGRPAAGDVVSAVVIAAEAAWADALATAVVADSGRALPALSATGAAALVQQGNGEWAMTPGLQRYLR